MKNILQEIIEAKKREVEAKKKAFPLEMLKEEMYGVPIPRDFKKAVIGKNRIAIIAEIKRASPSKGLLRENFDEMEMGKIYLDTLAQEKSVAAISVVTDFKYFAGNDQMLRNLRKISPLPLLRKDFIIDEYQIYESRFLGADAILLIASVLSQETLQNFIVKTEELKMTPLVEVHNEQNLQKALSANAQVIGINNRNLVDFSVDRNRTFSLIPLIPKEKIIVSESGFEEPEDLEPFRGKIDAVLIGSAFMQAPDPVLKLQQFLSA